MKATSQPIQAASVTAQPEFADHKGVRGLFGLSRSFTYNLAAEGKIQSVSLRRPGTVRGRRLFDCASIRNYLAAAKDAPVKEAA
jgi:hypothetical protein